MRRQLYSLSCYHGSLWCFLSKMLLPYTRDWYFHGNQVKSIVMSWMEERNSEVWETVGLNLLTSNIILPPSFCTLSRTDLLCSWLRELCVRWSRSASLGHVGRGRQGKSWSKITLKVGWVLLVPSDDLLSRDLMELTGVTGESLSSYFWGQWIDMDEVPETGKEPVSAGL